MVADSDSEPFHFALPTNVNQLTVYLKKLRQQINKDLVPNTYQVGDKKTFRTFATQDEPFDLNKSVSQTVLDQHLADSGSDTSSQLSQAGSDSLPGSQMGNTSLEECQTGSKAKERTQFHERAVKACQTASFPSRIDQTVRQTKMSAKPPSFSAIRDIEVSLYKPRKRLETTFQLLKPHCEGKNDSEDDSELLLSQSNIFLRRRVSEKVGKSKLASSASAIFKTKQQLSQNECE